MKKIVLLTGIMLLMVSVMSAQHPGGCQGGKTAEKGVTVQNEGPGHCLDMLPGLTDDQKKQIKAKGVTLHKELNYLEAQIKEKKAHIRTLELAPDPDLTALNKTIDEMMVLKGDIIKKKTAHHQEIRKMLNDEQKMIFDQHMGHSKCKGKGKKGHGSNCCEDGAMKGPGCGSQSGAGSGCGTHGAGAGSGCKGAGK